MKRGILIAAVLASQAHAQSPCRIYEYAELKDMPKERLVEMSCEYYRIGTEMLSVALNERKSGRQVAAQRSEREMGICSQEMGRIDRILEAQHGIKAPTCKPAAR